MKTFKKIKMALLGMLCLGLAFACTPEDPGPDNNGGGDNNNGYNTLLVGTWQLDGLTHNGEDLSQMLPNIKLSFYSDGTGMMNDNGETENNGFSWSISGNTITVTPRHGQYTFTIESLTATECSFKGTYLEMADIELQGDIHMHMTKINAPEPGPGPNPGGDFPVGTIWQYELSMTETDEGVTYDINISMRLHFNEGGQGILTMYQEAVVGDRPIYSDSEDMPFTYTYNSSANAGTITASFVDDETGETETETLTFTYDASANTITLINPDPEPDDPMGSNMVFTRVNK